MKAIKSKTIGLAIRENIIKKVQERVSSSSVYFFVGFSNVKSSSLSQLRNQLRLVDSYVFVAKNSLINKALEGLDLEKLEDYLQGETGIVSVYNEDIVKPCKAIVDFAKENEAFAIKGGIIEGRKINKEELESLAKLPSREVLLGQAVSGLAAPLTGFLACLNQIILKFVWVADEIKKVQSQKSKVQSQDKETQKKVENQEEKEQEEGKESKESKEEKGKPEQKQEEKKESKDKEDKEDKAKTEQSKEEKEQDDNKSKEK